MIQVFFNEKVIVFYNKADRSIENSVFGDKYHFSDPDESETRNIFQMLFSEECYQVGILCSDIKRTFDLFGLQFIHIDAAGGMIANDNGECLVIDRRGYIDLPKGKREFGETDEENALREVGEETGLMDVKIAYSLPCTYHIYRLGDVYALKCTHWYKMKVSGRPILTPQIEEDIVSAKWVSKAELKNLVDKTYSSLKVIFKTVADED